LRVDGMTGELLFVGDVAEFEARDDAPQPNAGQRGCGRELFTMNRANISSAEQGASYLFGGE
jgi:phosphogluconate dehydratase